MQVTSAAFTTEEKDSVRRIVQNLRISWHKESLLNNRTFTIGVSTIGGNDIIGINPGAIGSPGNYRYFDESAYVTRLGWERRLSYPKGGLGKAMAEAELDNTSGRFTPRFMGGNSELFTAIVPRRPAILSAGFNYAGIDNMIPQFAGIVTDQPRVDMRNRSVNLKMADYVDYFQGKYLDQATMFTSQRTDQVLESMLTKLGMSTAQYDLDTGINIVPFGRFEVNTKFSDIIGALVEAENGQFYQDENGIFRFENRQHYTQAPHTQVQKVITTSMVINSEVPDANNIVNVVEIKSNVREKRPKQIIFTLGSPLLLEPSADTPVFVNFEDPVLAMDTPSFWLANSLADGTGTNRTANISIKSIDTFALSAKITFRNSLASPVYLTALSLYGRPAKVSTTINYRAKDGSSVTAFEERLLSISNDFIQSPSWAQTYAQMILDDFSEAQNIQKITVSAMPDLQLGDLVSWQGRYWRVYDIKTTLDPASGFVQELTMLQRTIMTYFRIGISTIGGNDIISV